jgi:hypothetical protein
LKPFADSGVLSSMNSRLVHVSLAMALLLDASPARADFQMEKTLPLDSGGAFTLETEVGSVTVTGDSGVNVVVRVLADRDDIGRRMDFRFDSRPGAVRVKVTRRSHLVADLLRTWGWSDRVRFEVRVPRRTGVAVQTGGGAVQVTELEGGARLRTLGGPLQLRNIAGDVDARTNGGFIRVQDVRGSAHVSTLGGGIHVDQAGGRVEARTSGGAIVVRFAPGNGQGGALHSLGGGVYAAVDPSAALSIDASSAGGHVSSDIPVLSPRRSSRDALRADLNGGGPLLRLRTSGGVVRISGLER